MKTLVLVFHPHLEKSQVNRKLMDAANETGDVTVVDEYAAYPDFRINVEHEQRLIETHDRIVLQFPFYWYSSPALLKQWEDDVIKAGWAYGGGRALEGKEFMLSVSTGSPADSYTREGSHVRTMDELLSPVRDHVPSYACDVSEAVPHPRRCHVHRRADRRGRVQVSRRTDRLIDPYRIHCRMGGQVSLCTNMAARLTSSA